MSVYWTDIYLVWFGLTPHPQPQYLTSFLYWSHAQVERRHKCICSIWILSTCQRAFYHHISVQSFQELWITSSCHAPARRQKGPGQLVSLLTISFITQIQALWVLSQDHPQQITREQGWRDWHLSIVTYALSNTYLIVLLFSHGSHSMKGCAEDYGGTSVLNKMSLVLTVVHGTLNHSWLETLLSVSEIPSSFWLYVPHSFSFVKWWWGVGRNIGTR